MKHAVGGDALPHDLLARRAGAWQCLRQEAALGAGRHDDRVLDLLRLAEAQHLGAEVLGAVRPADAAARDWRRSAGGRLRRGANETQISRKGRGSGSSSTSRLSSLKAMVWAGGRPRHRAGRSWCARSLRQQVQEAAHDAVLVEALRLWRARLRCAGGSRAGGSAAAPAAKPRSGSKRVAEQFDQVARDRQRAGPASSAM